MNQTGMMGPMMGISQMNQTGMMGMQHGILNKLQLTSFLFK
ncbi:MAG TPA: hypothetical protein VIY98_08105 [Nitrososphaeraceae archaeon]